MKRHDSNGLASCIAGLDRSVSVQGTEYGRRRRVKDDLHRPLSYRFGATGGHASA